MKSIELIDTIRWIVKQLNILHNHPFRLGTIYSEIANHDPKAIKMLAEAVQDLTIAIEQIKRNTDALRVFSVFNLENLLLKKEFTKQLTVMVATPNLHHEIKSFVETLLWELEKIVSAADAFEYLTIPSEMIGRHESEDFVVLEVLSNGKGSAQISQMAAGVKAFEKSYIALSQIILGGEVAPAPEVLKIESGSSIQIHFNSMGEVAKHFKELIVEIWEHWINRKADLAISKDKAFLSKLETLEAVYNLRDRGVLNSEEETLFRTQVVAEMESMFGCNVYTDEIVHKMNFEDFARIEGKQIRQLPEPGTNNEDESVDSDETDGDASPS